MRKSFFDNVFINDLPTLDLHGETRDSLTFLVNDFISDNKILKNYRVLIVHGVGKGILRKELATVLKSNKFVEDFHINGFNQGCTIVYIKK